VIRLRAAEPADEYVFWELRRQVQPDLARSEHRSWWKAVVEHRFLAFDGTALVGVLRVSYQGEIHVLVATSERNKGLGTQMLEAIKPVMRERQYLRLWAAVDADNVASRGAFLTAGYAPTRFEVVL
jgi:RimJ/RimL family protein N-acetyltransferase